MQLHETPNASALVSFDDYLAELGKTRVTGYRWRKAGLIQTHNIFGRIYVAREEIARFEARAMAGDFAKAADTAKAVAASLHKRGKTVA